MASTEVIKRTRDKCQFCMKGQKEDKRVIVRGVPKNIIIIIFTT